MGEFDRLERTLENNQALRARLSAWECFEPPMDDYAALGYPETGFGTSDLESLAYVLQAVPHWLASMADGLLSTDSDQDSA